MPGTLREAVVSAGDYLGAGDGTRGAVISEQGRPQVVEKAALGPDWWGRSFPGQLPAYGARPRPAGRWELDAV